MISFSGKTQVAVYESILLQPTIRSVDCEIIVEIHTSGNEIRCTSCADYRKTLNSLLSRQNKSEASCINKGSPSNHTNYRYLNTPEKTERLQRMHKSLRVSRRQVHRIKVRLAAAIAERGSQVDSELHNDLTQIMKNNSSNVLNAYPSDSFAHLFWQQQRQATLLKDSRSMRWAPMMIRWCLYLRHLSTRSYATLRSSGAIKLPSQRTLRDYTHFIQATNGFSTEVDKQLMSMAKISTCPERDKYIIILMDEMHIKENLVYNKHTGIETISHVSGIAMITFLLYYPSIILGSLIGYTDLGDINTHLAQFEHSITNGNSEDTVANSMLVLMIRGLFSNLKFAYAQFPCTALAGDQMFEPFWEAAYNLERCGFKVLALTCDGLAANRRLFKLHSPNIDPEAFVHKVVNPYAADGRFVFFFSDPPHLVKTTRNGWANSHRQLWVSQFNF